MYKNPFKNWCKKMIFQRKKVDNLPSKKIIEIQIVGILTAQGTIFHEILTKSNIYIKINNM